MIVKVNFFFFIDWIFFFGILLEIFRIDLSDCFSNILLLDVLNWRREEKESVFCIIFSKFRSRLSLA